ncbi:hypothetical protein MPTK1_4g21970 [Marchantia polymorpha subsp. ruderalis]|uniref:Uncharacterized protein n=2 Tax=Marchantia polymorpha TaxID=3197 RepID=A0AAF6BCG8_MARPO|nr:hypothetical protein MARPO_0090s0025 [Marchantia polymorpha]BBN09702.1 hypothetical protein Mp_4g21970 [Marchantia polymorpha subsp. ruderalis]|eukprot:PTQ33284.1 hypothetical protein MARPO_0090s0025 [Marchantia polymorpha]
MGACIASQRKDPEAEYSTVMRRELAKMIYDDLSKTGCRTINALKKRKISESGTRSARQEVEADINKHKMVFFDLRENNLISPRHSRQLQNFRNEIEMDIRNRRDVEPPPNVGSTVSWEILQKIQELENTKSTPRIRKNVPASRATHHHHPSNRSLPPRTSTGSLPIKPAKSAEVTWAI